MLDKEVERKLAAHLFNETWRLIDKPDRTAEDDIMMIHTAHASRFHWQTVGNASNHAIGEWQISRVYSLLGLGASALYHGRLCLELSERQALGPCSKGCAHEAIARALSLDDKESARRHYQAACELAAAVEDPEDRNILESDLKTIAL